MARKMKDSGIEWIGEIPEGWEIAKAKYFIDISHGSDPKTQGFIPVYGSGSESFKTCGEYKEGPAVLIGRKGATLHIPHYIEGKYWNVDTAFDVKSKSHCILKFYYYLAACFDYKYYISQTTLPGMTQSNYYNMFLPVPSLSKQFQIATYLDAHGAAFDFLISKVRSSIEEYKKLKQTVITQAVTKGVRGEREMKNCNIGWIKELPSDWGIIPSKYLFKSSDTKKINSDEQLTASQQHGIITQKYYTELTGSKVVLANKGLDDWKHVEPFDFIISLRSFQGGLEMSETTGCITWHYIVLKPCRQIYSYYYKWLFKSEIYIRALQRTCNFIRDGQDLRYSNFVQVPLFEPPLEEQKEIADYLNGKCAEIDKLIAKKEQLVKELESYKKSLIYEVVTGKKEV